MKSNMPSNKKFGWTFTVIFGLLWLYAVLNNFAEYAYVLFVMCATFALVTLTSPDMFARMNHLWYALGETLGKVVSPIVLSIIFFIIFTPVSLITRAFGRDILLMKRKKNASHWIDRGNKALDPDSFKHQF